MYRLYYKKADSTEKILFYDTNNDDLALISPKLSIGVNIAGELSFTLPPNHPYYNELIADRTTTIYVYDDNKLIFKCFPMEQSIDLYKQKKLVCEGVMSFLNDSIQTQARYQHLTIAGYLQILINNHNADLNASLGDMRYFKLGNVTVTGTDDLYRYTNYQSTLTEIKEDLIDNYGGFIVPRYEEDCTYIDYYKDAIRVSNQTIQLGVNLTNYSSNLDATDYVTKLIPLGERQDEQVIEGLDSYLTIKSVNNNKEYLINQEAVDNFGVITSVVKWDKVTEPSILKRKGEQYLTDFQFNSVEIEAKAVDLSIIDKSLNKFQLLDSIKVYSKPHGMNKYFILQKLEKTLNDPSKDTLTLSGNVTGMSTKSKQTLTTITNDNTIDEDSILSQAQIQATAMLNGGNGGYVVIDVNENKQPNRILIMDKPSLDEAQDVIIMNKNGIGFSHDGGETYESAWTIDGHFVADYIASGKIAGNHNPSTYFDLDNAELISSANGWLTQIKNGYIALKKENQQKALELSQYALTFYDYRNGNKTGAISTGGNGQGNDIMLEMSNNGTFSVVTNNYWVAGFSNDSFVLQTDHCYFMSTDTGHISYSRMGGTGIHSLALCPNKHEYVFDWIGSALLLDVDGTNVWNSSDRRLKANINPISDAFIEACGSVELKQFTFTPNVYDKEVIHLGIIAQDIREAMEEQGINVDKTGVSSTFKQNDEDYYTVDKQEFLIGRVAYDERKIAKLEAKVKEQDEKIKELEDKYNELYNLINNLKGEN